MHALACRACVLQRFCRRYFRSLPEVVRQNASNPSYRFISFATTDKLGIELYDTIDEDGEDKAVLIVKKVRLAAQEAGVTVGSIITFLHNEKIPPGINQDDFATLARAHRSLDKRHRLSTCNDTPRAQVGELKAKGDSFVIGFDVRWGTCEAESGYDGEHDRRAHMTLNA